LKRVQQMQMLGSKRRAPRGPCPPLRHLSRGTRLTLTAWQRPVSCNAVRLRPKPWPTRRPRGNFLPGEAMHCLTRT